MDIKEFEGAVKAAGGKIGLLTKGAYNALQGMIAAGERITAAAECVDTKGSGAIAITEKNFYAVKMTGMFSSVKVSVSLDRINTVSLSGGAFSKDLNITEGTVVHTFPQVTNPDALSAAIQAGKNQIPPAPGAAPPPVDTAAELRKFKALLDDGIITQDDFDKKKAALLG